MIDLHRHSPESVPSNFCVVKDGKCYEGSRAEILSQVGTYVLTEDRKLYAKFHGFQEVGFHSYGPEYTDAEIREDAIRFLFNKLLDLGYRVYREWGRG